MVCQRGPDGGNEAPFISCEQSPPGGVRGNQHCQRNMASEIASLLKYPLGQRNPKAKGSVPLRAKGSINKTHCMLYPPSGKQEERQYCSDRQLIIFHISWNLVSLLTKDVYILNIIRKKI